MSVFRVTPKESERCCLFEFQSIVPGWRWPRNCMHQKHTKHTANAHTAQWQIFGIRSGEGFSHSTSQNRLGKRLCVVFAHSCFFAFVVSLLLFSRNFASTVK